MNTKRIKYIVLGWIILAGVSFMCILSAYEYNHLIKASTQKQNTESMNKTYGEQGLVQGETISSTPELITRDYLYYNDRTVEVYNNNSQNEEDIARIVSNFMAALPNQINKYVMLVPPRISFESGVEKYTNNPLDSIKSIYRKLDTSINVVSVDSILKEHENEYLYYRTEPEWTSLGAYYGAKAFCDKKGIQAIDLSQYREEKFIEYIGSYYQLPNNCISSNNSDYVEFYIPREGLNKETISTRRSEDNYETIKCPTVCLSRQGTDIFVGGNFSYAILEGDVKDGKTLLVLADSNGKILSPWLTHYYKNVYVINIKWYQEGEEGIRKILQDYEIEDVLIATGLDKDNNTLVYPRLESYIPD